MKTGIIFDSEDEVIFTVDELKDLGKESPKRLVEYFQATAIYRDVMKDLIRDNGISILSVNDEPLSELRVKLVHSGYNMLVEQMIETFGEDTALMIVAGAHNAINLEKNEKPD